MGLTIPASPKDMPLSMLAGLAPYLAWFWFNSSFWSNSSSFGTTSLSLSCKDSWSKFEMAAEEVYSNYIVCLELDLLELAIDSMASAAEYSISSGGSQSSISSESELLTTSGNLNLSYPSKAYTFLCLLWVLCIAPRDWPLLCLDCDTPLKFGVASEDFIFFVLLRNFMKLTIFN